MIPKIPDNVVESYINCVDSEDFDREKVIMAETIMAKGLYLMEAAILRIKGTSTAGIRQITIDKRLKEKCELQAMKSVANSRENKKISTFEKKGNYLEQKPSLVLFLTLAPFFIGLILGIILIVMDSNNWGLPAIFLGAGIVTSCIVMPIYISQVTGLKKKLRNKYPTIDAITNDLIKKLPETEIFNCWRERYNRFDNQADLCLFGEPAYTYFDSVCNDININPAEFEVDLGKMKGGGSTFIGLGSERMVAAGIGLSALSKIGAATRNAAANAKIKEVEKLLFYNNLAEYFNEHILQGANNNLLSDLEML